MLEVGTESEYAWSCIRILFVGAEIKNLSVWLVTTYEYSLLVIIVYVINMYKLYYILHNSIPPAGYLQSTSSIHFIVIFF